MNADRPQWLKNVDAMQYAETGWARYVETPKMFAEGTEYAYINESGERVTGTCSGLVVVAHNEKIRRVVMRRNGTREYPRVLDIEMDD